MRLRIGLVVLMAAVAVICVISCGGQPPEPKVDVDEGGVRESETPEAVGITPDIRVEDVGFATPESVLYDRTAGVYLVSNINGSPLDEDGNGFISRVAPDGLVIELKWISEEDPEVTLNAPKGLAIVGDTLYVADITVVRLFDRVKGTPLGEVAIPEGTFVNDLAAGSDGRVTVSDSGVVFGETGAEDTGSAAVYRFGPDLQPVRISNADTLDRPNGVLESADRGLLVAPFGGNTVYTFDDTGQRVDVAELPNGGLDGIIETIDGRLLVSSWGGGAIYAVDGDDNVTTFAEGLNAPADLGYDSDRDVVIVPLFKDNALVIMAAGSVAPE